MNTIGKILVILNFLFAVFVGVFLVFDFAMRTRWHEAYSALKIQTDVLKADRDTTSKASTSLANDNKTLQQKIADLQQKLKETEGDAQDREGVERVKFDELKQKLVDSDRSLREALVAKQRLVDEIATLTKAKNEREALIVKLDGDVKMFRVVAVNNESLAKTRQTQNELLLDQINELTRKIARMDAGANVEGIQPRANGFNPPAVSVKGKIDRVDPVDNGLVEITLGTDHGITKNHTLDVYRFNPAPKYLGTLRIVEAYHHKSVARLVPSGNAALRPLLKAGDQVGSSIK